FIGPFTMDGHYDLADGKCVWTKHYLGKHNVYYLGFNEGKGIWGTWRIPDTPTTPDKGGFHIWPEGMGDPTTPKLAEQAEPPITVEDEVEVGEPVGCR
ncbi:MAG TPA: hypothetical protein VGZ47_05400, partial [Gemmataceae bacterium]|nr:hypothetical protein [Gemmataceae bacterium]